MKERFRAAIAVAEAVARSFFGGAVRQPDRPLAGLPDPADLAAKAVASVTAQALARGPRTLTETRTDTFARVGLSSATAVATSVSVALSARSPSGLAAAGERLERGIRAPDRDRAGAGQPAAGAVRGEPAGGHEPCPACEADVLPAVY